MRWIIPAALAVFLGGCGDKPAEPTTPMAPVPSAESNADPHSYANSNAVRTSHLTLDLTVDFSERKLVGSVTHQLDRGDAAVPILVVDTRGLVILEVTDGASGETLAWTLGDADETLGAPLSIGLERATTRVKISYETTPEASGLQWLEPAQTAGGEHPFLFSQAQAIHARSFVPLQDTPAVRTTYEAVIRTPDALRAVMSAKSEPTGEPGVFRFSMPQAIPSYLIALAVGDLEFAPMSDRTGVYAEPSVLESAAWEFAETEQMMVVSEALFGPYRWGRYDLLILPPSFPFGGMENPRLSFITPTVIAGDRSLVALIAHELAHSWSGNLVTNGAWADLWLNEGFTVYLESRIMDAVYGEERRRMEDVLGYQDLVEDLASLPPEDQTLVLPLDGRDPDEAFSAVAYEKGRLLLVWLAAQIGQEAMDTFLRGYFDAHAFQSMTTDAFVAYALDTLPAGSIDPAALDAWLHEPGLPTDAILPDSDAFSRIDGITAQWLAGEITADAIPIADWSVHEALYFLSTIPADTDLDALATLDEAHGLTGSSNAEIAHRWFRIAIDRHYEPALPALADYLRRIGRIKLVEPLYRALFATDWGQPIAREVYAEARAGYHPMTQARIDAMTQ